MLLKVFIINFHQYIFYKRSQVYQLSKVIEHVIYVNCIILFSLYKLKFVYTIQEKKRFLSLWISSWTKKRRQNSVTSIFEMLKHIKFEWALSAQWKIALNTRLRVSLITQWFRASAAPFCPGGWRLDAAPLMMLFSPQIYLRPLILDVLLRFSNRASVCGIVAFYYHLFYSDLLLLPRPRRRPTTEPHYTNLKKIYNDPNSIIPNLVDGCHKTNNKTWILKFQLQNRIFFKRFNRKLSQTCLQNKKKITSYTFSR